MTAGISLAWPRIMAFHLILLIMIFGWEHFCVAGGYLDATFLVGFCWKNIDRAPGAKMTVIILISFPLHPYRSFWSVLLLLFRFNLSSSEYAFFCCCCNQSSWPHCPMTNKYNIIVNMPQKISPLCSCICIMFIATTVVMTVMRSMAYTGIPTFSRYMAANAFAIHRETLGYVRVNIS